MNTILTQVVGSVCLVSALSVGFMYAFFAKQNILTSADEKLFSAVTFYHDLLGRDFHNGLTDVNSLTDEQYTRILDRNGEHCRKLGLQYLWTVLDLQDRIVFTSGTRSNLEDPSSPYAKFFETHRDPEAFRPAMGEIGTPAYSTFHNEWGEGRMILIPLLDAKGRRYIMGASIQLKGLNLLIRNSILLASLFASVLFCFVWIISRRFTLRLVNICGEVTSVALQIKEGNLDAVLPKFNVTEAIHLTHSLDEMRNQLKIRIQDLETNNSVLNQIVSERNFAESQIKDFSEIQALMIKLSSQYVNIPFEKMNETINSSLKELGEFVGADRSYIFDYDWANSQIHNSYEWCKPGISVQIQNAQNIRIKEGEIWWNKHRSGEAIYIADVKAMPDNENNKEELLEQEIKSLVTYPILHKGDCIGFVGFDWVTKYHAFSENEEKLLSIFAGLLVNLRIRKEIDRELQRFKSVTDKSLNGTAIADLNGYLTYINDAFAKAHGYEPEELIGKHISVLHSEEQLESVKTDIQNLKEKGFFENNLSWHRDRSGKTFPMIMSGLSISDENGNPEYIAASAIDITELIQSKNRIESLLKTEARLNDNMRNFTFIVSHNLRIHTANMMGIMMILKETEPQLFQNEYILMLKSASENLEETIRDLNRVLEIKVQSQIKKNRIPLHQVVNESIKDLVISPEESNVLIINEIPKDFVLQSESHYLKSILSHLIGNSIKYSAVGRNPWVKVSIQNSSTESRIFIEDNGIGIDLEHNGEDLFKMYKKFHNSPESKGYGLFLTQMQVEALGGTIEVESKLNSGSKFEVRFPNE